MQVKPGESHPAGFDPDDFIVYGHDDGGSSSDGADAGAASPPPPVRMDPRVAKLLKPHQVEGVRFLCQHLVKVRDFRCLPPPAACRLPLCLSLPENARLHGRRTPVRCAGCSLAAAGQ